jgi:ATP-dependent DNA ligase
LAVLRSPTFIPPCEPTLRDRLPKGEGWCDEVKHDGYRLQVRKAGRMITLYTSNEVSQPPTRYYRHNTPTPPW